MAFVTNTGWRRRWVLSYIFDYVVVIFLILAFSALDLAEPYKQRFSLNNESLQYPMADPERISPLLAAIVSCLFPLCVIIFWSMLIDGMYSHHKPAGSARRFMNGPWTMSDRLWEMNCGILGLGLSVAFTICVTGALKNATGKPRPDVISRCIPPFQATNHPVFGLFDPKDCTQKDPKILKDGFKSWPSGHSSTAFAGLGYLSLFLAGKLHIMDNRGEVWKTFIVLVPLLAASLVAVSRIMDARHHPFDVITGSMLGAITAWIAYRQYYPAITKPELKGRAYPRRVWGTDSTEVPATSEFTYRADLEARAGSSESLGSDKARQRALQSGSPRAYGSQGGPQEFELLNNPQRQGSFPSQHSQHGDHRESVDMGDRSRRDYGMDPGQTELKVGRLSPGIGEENSR
ncbi:phosphatidic acid phosphatase type 2/haloperoxidase [Pyronema domesticum]|uniref:Similar to Probable diacylglycerol pyrophosphate phosphatase 1 acc. no. Q9UUA6 n=1 Tax=Pyronema omphalodes (strain CBS 100304) TaxID=1076935 RepID=U4LKZ1_PYROM|nr:phosphatidic acid phosphatase type 2/haloperoxidase [Pyronema domesticum]CCX30030.1 Similar to Probable diacylglycerol pyrophosphate phosphatase 1; acc. no. Q9UUA6 [Pyronema omphalodes CBS 100304]